MITVIFRLTYLISLFLLVLPAHAQQPAKKEPITISFAESGWSANGSLVLGVLIHAPTNEDVKLYQGSLDQGTSRVSHYTAFTMAGSYLIDGYTGEKIEALSGLPSDLAFGPMLTATVIRRSTAIELCVAFPAPPPPPLKNGKPQPYKLLFYSPLNTPPVAVIPPPK